MAKVMPQHPNMDFKWLPPSLWSMDKVPNQTTLVLERTKRKSLAQLFKDTPPIRMSRNTCFHLHESSKQFNFSQGAFLKSYFKKRLGPLKPTNVQWCSTNKSPTNSFTITFDSTSKP
jgi:hypothetical protein